MSDPIPPHRIWQDARDASESEVDTFRRYLFRTYARMVLGILVATVLSCLIARSGILLFHVVVFYPVFCLIGLVFVALTGYFTLEDMSPFSGHMLFALYVFLWAMVLSPFVGAGIWIGQGIDWLLGQGGVIQESSKPFSIVTALIVSLGFTVTAAVFAAICYFGSVSSERSISVRAWILVAFGLLVGLLGGVIVGGSALLLLPIMTIIYGVALFFISKDIAYAYDPKDSAERMESKSISGSFFLLGIFFAMFLLILRLLFLLIVALCAWLFLSP